MSLPFDVSRCVSVSNDEGQLVSPCNNCRRYLEREPSGEKTHWMSAPRQGNGTCLYYMKTEEKK